MKTLDVLIVDDHQLFVDGLCDILSQEPSVRVAGICNTAGAIRHKLAEAPVDLVLLDLQLGNESGLDVCEYLQQTSPEIKVIVLTMFGERSFITQALQRGAVGYVLKNSGREELLRAIRVVGKGERYYGAEVSEIIMKGLSGEKEQGSMFRPKLSPREKQVLELIVRERTTPEIAKALYISQKTVESHRGNLLTKLDARNAAGLVRKALEWNLLDG